MLTIKTSLDTAAPARLLKPARLLARLRPVSLATICENLAGWDYLGEAVKLAQRFAPEALAGWPKVGGWDDLLREALSQIEAADYCEVDWEMLDADYQYWMEDPDSGMNHFAQWLYHIPVARYGFSDYDDGWPEQYPPMALLKGLLVADWGDDFLVSLIDEYGLEADWGSVTHRELIERVATADFSAYDAPLCWLPSVAAIARGHTGNPLLDYSNYFDDDPTPYSWDQADALRELWQRTKPEVKKLRAFLNWCNGPAEMQAVVNALVGPSTGSGRSRGERKRKWRGNRKLNTLVEILMPGTQERARVRI